jgi:hypothetical protein
MSHQISEAFPWDSAPRRRFCRNQKRTCSAMPMNGPLLLSSATGLRDFRIRRLLPACLILRRRHDDQRPPHWVRRAAVSATRRRERHIHLRPEHAERIGTPPGLVGHQKPGVAIELLERLDPGVNRRLGREHEARQAEVPSGHHSREDDGDYRGDALRGLDPVDHAGRPSTARSAGRSGTTLPHQEGHHARAGRGGR